MQALLCKKLGDPTGPISETSSIVISTDHPIPPLKTPTSVLIRVKAVSVNYGTVLQLMGKYQEKPPLPFVPGADFSGVVEATGEAVSRVNVGDTVCCLADGGSYSEKAVVEENRVFLVPPGCDMVAAGGLPVAFGTSHVGLVYRAALKPGQVLLVLGAAGGVGLSAVQIGKVCGAVVIAVAKGPEKERLLKSLGADHVVDSTVSSIIPNVKEYLKSRNLKGVDVLYDPVGGKLLKDSLKLLNWGANILVIGFASGEIPVIPTNITLVKNWTVHGLYWGSYLLHRPEILVDSMQELLSWLSKGVIHVNVSHTYRLSEANLAFSAIMQRKAIGKIMVTFEDNTPGNDKAVRSKL
uniref:TSA: Wollemia nobilis Ref_Wollemi_Transcript_28380_1602 transcribed RNA sequence n=1 Tax=Wollemia nobilis TaxID=56998 RepID=A0A0C9S3T7_9CONI